RLHWKWGNQVIGARWVQPFGGGWIGESRLGFSRFAERLAFLDFGDVRFESRVDQLIWRGDVSRDFSPELSVRFGLSADRMDHWNLAEAGGTNFLAAEGAGVLGAGYGSIRWRPRAWIIEPGVRIDSWEARDSRHTVVSPRFAAKRF